MANNIANKYNTQENVQSYLKKSVENNCAEVANAQKGERAIVVNKAAFSLGQIFQGMHFIGISPEIGEYVIKAELFSANSRMMEPLDDSEINSKVIRSFNEGKSKAADLSFLLDGNNRNENTSKPQNDVKSEPLASKTNKVQVRLITDNPDNRFIFLKEEELIPRKATEEDVTDINNLCRKAFTIDVFEELDLRIHDTGQTKGIILWDSKDKILTLDEANKVIHVEGRTDLISAVTLGLQREFTIISHYNKGSEILIIDDLEHIFLMDSDNSQEFVMTKIKSSMKIKARFIRFPAGSKDLSEYIFNGFDKKDLIKLIDESEIVLLGKKDEPSISGTNPDHTERKIITANERLALSRNLPPLKRYWGDIIIENELIVLFGPTGCGKSIFAVQLADAITRGESLFDLPNDCDPQKVLFVDFELSDRQFRARYTDSSGKEMEFSDNFLFAPILVKDMMNELNSADVSSFVLDKIEEALVSSGAYVVIVDNITYLDSSSLHDADKALKLMKRLNAIKSKYNVTMIILGHTPKRSNSQSLFISDLSGSSNISNFVDSVFGINNSVVDSQQRYIKQLKPSRSAEIFLDHENVMVVYLINKDSMLHFKLIEYSSERIQIGKFEGKNTDNMEKVQKAASMLLEGKSYRDIALSVGISPGSITKWKTRYPEIFNMIIN